jgi:alkanesulfonate monooxygenase SsuD/methylene tetrahydromethanopterin reductase-like flavin-dependent oxidoreductase (luciferase family)
VAHRPPHTRAVLSRSREEGGVGGVGQTPGVALTTGVCILPEFPWTEARPRWLEAEASGFSTAWTYDHLSWRTLRDGPWFGAVPLLSAVAVATTTVRIGTLVTSPNFRHPVPLAKEVMTIDDLSGGRLDVGVGAGADSEDARVLGEPPWPRRERTDRFDEFVTLLDQLLTAPATSSRGHHYRAEDARQIPGCVQSPRVPFTIAATGRRGLGLAARYGAAWVTYGPRDDEPAGPVEWVQAVAAQLASLSDACRAAGRDPAAVRRMVLVPLALDWAQSSPGAWDDFTGRLEEAGFTDVVVHWPRPWDRALAGPSPETFAHLAPGA